MNTAIHFRSEQKKKREEIVSTAHRSMNCTTTYNFTK